MDIKEKLLCHFNFLYKGNYNKKLVETLLTMMEDCRNSIFIESPKWKQDDIVLITYGDSIFKNGENPLQTLNTFLSNYLEEEISVVHILPFFPYSSDDGFSVIDYRQVDPNLGNWNDIAKLSDNYKLMFDLVINHISQYSQWFQNYLNDISPGKDYFIEADPKADLSEVTRPRSLSLLSKYQTTKGEKYVWTTFSADQIDLDFRNQEVLTAMLDIFLFYIQKGARIIRLDAIAFLWKEIGTSCLHLPQTHEIVKLMRIIANEVNPSVIILTETNVPNKENLSYFGNGDEADMVYQFSLPPLLLYTLFSGNSEYLLSWSQSLPEIPVGCTFLNFTASHDGIGVRPLEGLLPQDRFEELISALKSFGAFVSTRQNRDGSNSPYEINITYFDALKGTSKGFDTLQEQRFICSQTIMMAMKGIPAFYIHSLLSTNNYFEGVNKTGSNRSINRRKWQSDEIISLLNSDTHHSRILKELKRIIRIRQNEMAFHPDCNQRINDAGTDFFIISRDEDKIISISNITAATKKINLSDLFEDNFNVIDLLSGSICNSMQVLQLLPYQTLWLKK
jgi:sucrose phosphorylase